MAVLLAVCVPGIALGQKYPGTTLQAPPPPVARPMPMPAPSPAPPAAAQERDPEARALADRLPLDPATANLRNRLPADVPGTIRALGLRVPNGSRTDLSTRPTSVRELIDALVH